MVIEERADGWCYVLSHDRMAEVLVRLVDDEGAYAGLGVDAELLSVRRFVTLQSELFAAGEVAQATEVPAAHFRRIEEHAEALLWGEERRRWWAACRERRRSRRRRSLMRRGIAAAVVVLVALGAWTWADRRGKRLALLEQVAEEGPAAAFAALARLTAEPGADAGELLERLRQREKPLDVLERGLDGVGEELRGEAVLRVAEVALPLLEETPEDPVLIASIVWALDFFAAREPALKERASALRDRVLGPLRQSRPPPALPECRGSGPSAAGSEDPDWADIPGGTFIPDDWWRGGPGAGRDEENNADERLMYHVRISISTFRMKRHRVTNAEYRRLIPEHQGEDGLPATDMAWYQAYTYAAWMGGRLPTAWEWEYAARAGCAYAYCRRDGSEATVDDVARWVGNATHSNSPEASKKPVEQLEPNPWGLFDILGSDSEMNANLARGIPVDFEVDPPGPAGSATGYRAVRRITWVAAELVVANGLIDPDRSGTGIRVALPACSSAGHSATGGQE
ncbi:MAG: formylglycine-generating enzyme family protein [bacterium]|nr:formylglycine-generating enzyme family protein [bacterium]